MDKLISRDNEVFASYAFWSGVLVVKVLAMAILTAIQRVRTSTFANPEDLPSTKVKVKFGNESVERVRRAHRNDLENILPLITIGFFYVLTNPSATIAINLFRVTAIARIIHTIVYTIIIIPQPARGLAFGIPFFGAVFMALNVILHFC